MAREDFTAKVKRVIQNYSSGSCMICKNVLHSPKIAHIIPASENGPRSEFRGTFGTEFIKSADNGLCLCQGCHDTIDDEGLNNYSLEELMQINQKYKYDYTISEEYKKILGVGEVANANELGGFYNLLLQALDMDDEENESLIKTRGSFVKIPVNEKITKNSLVPRQARLIKQQYAFEFQAFRKTLENSKIISEKIKSAIKILYERVKSADNEKSNSEIFDDMLRLMHDPSNQVIGTQTVLIYFFIICEVFEV